MEPVMPPLTAKQKAALARLDYLPDSAAVPLNICALLSGNSERTWRRSPPIPTFNVSRNKKAANLGLLRRLNRGELSAKPTT
jgi:hypothetical protein